MLYVTLGASVLLLVGANLAAHVRGRAGEGIAGGLLGPVVLLGGCLFTSPVVLIQAAGLAVLSVVLSALGRGRRWFVAGSVVVTLLAWAAVAPTVWDAHRQYSRLREQYPFERLADRVPPLPSVGRPNFDPLPLAEAEAHYDVTLAHAGHWGRRNWQLRRLHEERVAVFANSPGFGQVRMITRRPEESTLSGEHDGHDKPVPQPTAGESVGTPSAGTTLADRVRRDVLDFTRPEGWGYRNADRVAGFLPHAFSGPSGRVEGWVVERVELVGLLLAPDPRVYVSETLPRMDELRAAPTRHPDGFESPALAKLRAGEELVHDAPLGRLLGAIRSAKQCLTCHGGERGELLGAFSYRLSAR